MRWPEASPAAAERVSQLREADILLDAHAACKTGPDIVLRTGIAATGQRLPDGKRRCVITRLCSRKRLFQRLRRRVLLRFAGEEISKPHRMTGSR